MRPALLALLAAALFAAPAAALDVAPRSLVLRTADIPAGWTPSRHETGVRTNEQEGRDRESRMLIARLGRLTGYSAEWRREPMESIVSRADVFRSRKGARGYVDLAGRSFRTSGIKGLRRSSIDVGDAGYLFHTGPDGELTWVVWRSGPVVGVIAGWGISRDASIGLARRQQQRIALALR